VLLRLYVRCCSLSPIPEEDEADVSVAVNEPDFGDVTSIWSAEESMTEDVAELCSSHDGLLDCSSESDDDLSHVSSLDNSASSVWYSELEFRSRKSVWSTEESVTQEVVEPCSSQDGLLERSSESDDDLFYVSSLDDSASSVWDFDDDDYDDDDDDGNDNVDDNEDDYHFFLPDCLQGPGPSLLSDSVFDFINSLFFSGPCAEYSWP